MLDELGVRQAIFVGFSWGATVGCWLAALHPERTAALVLVEGGHVDFADLPGLRPERTLDDLIGEAEGAAAREGSAFGSHTPAVAGAMVHGLCREPSLATYPRLAAAETPILFVGARQDVPSAFVERLGRVVPQCEKTELAASGQELLREAPAEVAHAVGDWFAGCRPAS